MLYLIHIPFRKAFDGGAHEAVCGWFKKWMVIAAGLAMLLVVLLVSQFLIFEKDEGYQATAFAMGSYVQQTLYGKDAEEVSSDAAHAVTELEQLISWQVDGSDIAALNQAAGAEAMQLDVRTMDVLSGRFRLRRRQTALTTPPCCR